jgi:hypothetical protein
MSVTVNSLWRVQYRLGETGDHDEAAIVLIAEAYFLAVVGEAAAAYAHGDEWRSRATIYGH